MKLLFLLFFFPVIAFASPMMKLPWQWYSDPNIMSSDLERNFTKLPLEGHIQDDQRFWSGDYWALNRGNINYRWHSPQPAGFRLRSPTIEEAKFMSTEQLSYLSPSEKYDLYTGNYTYPLRQEVEKIANRRAESWEGICHGWAPSTMNHKEPTAKTLVNADGISIPFGSSDIKALLAYYYADGFESPTHQMGWRCYTDDYYENYEEYCEDDLNAGAFHMVIANKIALRNEGVIVDIMRGAQVWNHPIVSYSSRVIKYKNRAHDSAPGTVRRAKIETYAKVVLTTRNSWLPVKGTPDQKETSKKYVYWLDLDKDNNILGGEWKSDDRPDFLWVKYKPATFEGTLSRLPELLNDDPAQP
ncbi:MAG: hypothetical protein ACJ76H_09325 [Bacteriovoracaceae bacterium]